MGTGARYGLGSHLMVLVMHGAALHIVACAGSGL